MHFNFAEDPKMCNFFFILFFVLAAIAPQMMKFWKPVEVKDQTYFSVLRENDLLC